MAFKRKGIGWYFSLGIFRLFTFANHVTTRSRELARLVQLNLNALPFDDTSTFISHQPAAAAATGSAAAAAAAGATAVTGALTLTVRCVYKRTKPLLQSLRSFYQTPSVERLTTFAKQRFSNQGRGLRCRQVFLRELRTTCRVFLSSVSASCRKRADALSRPLVPQLQQKCCQVNAQDVVHSGGSSGRGVLCTPIHWDV